MTSIESIIDIRIARVVKFGHESDWSLKMACVVAASVVGTYSGVTQEMAKQTKRSVSTIENYAHAFRLYAELRSDPAYIWKARRLWRALPTSHWWLAYDIQTKGYDALRYLQNAEWNGWSGRDMMQEFRRDMEAGNAPMVLRRVFVTFRGLADELAKSPHLTPAQADAVAMVREAFR
jgi:hypothetical protein